VTRTTAYVSLGRCAAAEAYLEASAAVSRLLPQALTSEAASVAGEFARRFLRSSLLIGLINAAVDLAGSTCCSGPTDGPWQFVLYNFVALVLAKNRSYVFWNSLWTFRGGPGAQTGSDSSPQAHRCEGPAARCSGSHTLRAEQHGSRQSSRGTRPGNLDDHRLDLSCAFVQRYAFGFRAMGMTVEPLRAFRGHL